MITYTESVPTIVLLSRDVHARLIHEAQLRALSEGETPTDLVVAAQAGALLTKGWTLFEQVRSVLQGPVEEPLQEFLEGPAEPPADRVSTTSLVLEAVNNSLGRVTSLDVQKDLDRLGRQVATKDINACLVRLHKRGKIRRVNRGTYRKS